MKKKITVTLSYVMEFDEEDQEDYEYLSKLDECRDIDYDNIGRPLNHLEDVGWEITRSTVKTID